MTDERLQELIAAEAPSYRVPKDPPLDAMWARIEDAHFGAHNSMPTAAPVRGSGAHHGMRRWLAPAAGIAATLLIGVGIGRFTAGTGASTEPATVTVADANAAAPLIGPLQRTTSAYLDEAEMLLAALPKDAKGVDARFVSDAKTLLVTTRLLLDSPVGSDPRMRDVLEDLELVLAQVARLRTAPRAEELTFIAEAVDERDMVPRLRTVAAAMSYSDY